jgi:hypothetical protein
MWEKARKAVDWKRSKRWTGSGGGMGEEIQVTSQRIHNLTPHSIYSHLFFLLRPFGEAWETLGHHNESANPKIYSHQLLLLLLRLPLLRRLAADD